MSNGKAVGGLFDICIGVPDLIEAIAYWELFGYRVGDIATLDERTARDLYGAPQGGRVVRLWHGESDHGLIRLMQWDQPTGSGLGLAPFKVQGSRWNAGEVAQVSRIFGHAKYHREAGYPIEIFRPDAMPSPDCAREPFRKTLGSAFEMAILQPLYRQVLFERADFPSPLYGKIQPGSFFEASQVTHGCMITCGVPGDAFDFYDRVLGLRRSGDFDLSHAEIGTSGKDIFQLEDGEGFHMFRFDDSRSGDGALKRSGRLIFFNFRPESALEDLRELSRPGALGHSLYSWRVRGLEAALKAAEQAGARDIRAGVNEFGERSALLTAPDGTPWMLIEAEDTLPLREKETGNDD